MPALSITEAEFEKGDWFGLEAVLGPGACAKYHFLDPSPQFTLMNAACKKALPANSLWPKFSGARNKGKG